MEQAFSWIVTILGLVGFYLAGKKVWWCWYINIVNQIAWVIFAIITDYYAFLLGTLFYFIVFTKNAYHWTREHFDAPIIDGVEKLVGDHEAQMPSYVGVYCANIHKKTRLACCMHQGHDDVHIADSIWWSDEDGEYTNQFSGRVAK